VNIPLGGSLTAVAKLPPGATRTLKDPYAPKKSPWPRVILLVLFLGVTGWGLWRLGLVHRWWPKCPLPEPPHAAAEPAADGAPPAETNH
jgi:hypothetical protein